MDSKAKAICEDVKYICKNFGERYSGSEGEKRASEYFAEKLSCCASDVSVEEFSVHPSANLGWIAISVSCALVAFALYFLSPMLTILLLLVGGVPLVFHYMLCNRLLDPLFRSATSQNVTAVKKPSGEVKRKIYLVANVDAPKENGIKYRFGGIMWILHLALDYIGILYFLAISVARWVIVGGIGAELAEGSMLYAGLAGLVFAVPLFLSYFNVTNKVIDGANTNLTGCEVALAAFEHFSDVTFENTEIGVIITGSGAVGLRGAKAWCDKHEDEGKDAMFVSLSSLRDLSGLRTRASGKSNAMSLVLESANAVDLKCATGGTPLVSTDNKEFKRRGFDCADIVAVSKVLPDYYRTRYDSFDNLSEDCIDASLRLVIEIVSRFAKDDVPSVCEEETVSETVGTASESAAE